MSPGHITDLIIATKEDKSIVQPWRNYALKALNEALAFVEKGQRVSNLTPPAGSEQGRLNPHVPHAAGCSCPGPGVLNNACPVHGSTV